MLRRIGIVCVALLMVVGTADVFAQGRPSGGRFGGGRGGFGGFGGFGRGQSIVGVIRVPEVQEEIELTQTQKDELGDILEAPRFGQRGQGGPGGPGGRQRGPGQDGQGQDGQRGQRPELSEEERAQFREQFEQRRREAAEREKEQENKIAEVLEKPQMDRLLGIYIQVAGTASLDNDRVADALELSGQQKEEVAAAREASQQKLRDQMREAFQGGQRPGEGDREAFGAKMRELREEADKQVLANLTDAQRDAYEKMKGAEFEMPRPAFGGPGGGFRGGQGGQGGDGGNRPRRPQRPGSDDSV